MLGPEAVSAAQVADSKILYLEGYLWDPAEPRAAMHKAMDAAREAGTEGGFHALRFVRRRAASRRPLGAARERRVDILFANEAEIMSLAGNESAEEAALAVAAEVTKVVVTRSEKGAFALSNGQSSFVPAEPIDALVDTTGAGDLFAAGYLAGEARGLGLERSLKLGAICAAEVIQHYGARPEADLKALARNLIA